MAVLSFLATRKDAVVVTTAPTGHQVKNLLWGEIGRMHASAKLPLPGEPDMTQLRIGPKWYALGISTDKPGRFQGFHAGSEVPDDPDADVDVEAVQKRELNEEPEDIEVEFSPEEMKERIEQITSERPEGGLLFVFDEAAGIDQKIYFAAKGAMTSPETYVLLIGNPDLDLAEAHEFVRSHGDGSEYVRIKVGAEPNENDPLTADFEWDHIPNWLVTDLWLEERKRDYGEGTPIYMSKVWAQFASGDASCRVVPHSLLLQCEKNQPKAHLGAHMGVDVSREGGDWNCATLMVHGKVRAMHKWRTPPGHPSPLMAVANTILGLRTHWGEALATEPDFDIGFLTEDLCIPLKNVHVDSIGIGAGVCDRLRQRGYRIDEVDVSTKPRGEWRDLNGAVVFKNRRAELHWTARRAAEEGLLQMDRSYSDAWREAQWAEFEHRELAAGTTIQVTAKKELKKAYGRSPDCWDSVLLCFSRSGKKAISFRAR